MGNYNNLVYAYQQRTFNYCIMYERFTLLYPQNANTGK